MPRPNNAQLALLRSKRHRTKIYLGVYQPKTVLKAQVNNANAAQGDYEIVVDNITEGSINLILGGMTMYVGSNPGGKDLGRIRVRSATGSTITVAENDHIQWANNVYVWVVRYWEPWAVYPRITLDGNNIPTFYKDYDIEYSDQNYNMDPVVCMGPHAAYFRETGTVVHLDYSSSGSFLPSAGSLSSYAWWFEGGSPTGSTQAHPTGIAYSTPGHYTTHLKVTASTGKTFTGRRHLMIYDRPGLGTSPPILNWGISSLEGNRDHGGWTGRFWVREEADRDKIVDGALIVLFTDDWYANQRISMGGNAYKRSSILFVGYVEGESIRYNSFTSRLEFRVSSLTIISDLKNTFSATLESTTGPSYWYEMFNLTLDKGIIHFLRWQTTLLSIADFARTGFSTPVQYIDFSRGTIYSEVAGLLQSAREGKFVSDRQGKMWTELEVNYVATGSRTQLAYPDILDLSRADWEGEFSIEREYLERASYIEAGGIAYSGPTTGTFDPYIGGAPGDAPAYAGSVQRRTGLILTGQLDVNGFAGLALADMNAEYPLITFSLIGDYRFVDIAPQQFIRCTITAADTFRDILWNKKRVIPQDMTLRYDAREETLQYDLTVKPETSGPLGETIDIPVDPPFEAPDLPYWDVEFPPIQPFPSFAPPILPPVGLGAIVYVCYGQVLARTRNFWDASPNWEEIVTPADLSSGAFTGFVLNPQNPQGSALLVSGNQIWRTDDLDTLSPAWSSMYSAAQYPTHLVQTVDHVKPWIGGRLWSAAVIRQASASGCPTAFAQCLTHVRAPADTSSWTQYTSGISRGNVGSPGMVQPTAYAGGSVYIQSEFTYYYSLNAGVTFNQKWEDPPKIAWIQPLQHLGNSAGNILYVVRETAAGGDRQFYWSSDFGLTVNNISLLYGGNTYTPYGFDNSLGQMSENFWIHPKTGVAYSMLKPNGDTASVFAQYSTSWLAKTQFSGAVAPMCINYADNGEKHYALGGNAGERIVGSNDFGANWYDKEGDFASAVRTFTGIGNRAAIQVVWTA